MAGFNNNVTAAQVTAAAASAQGGPDAFTGPAGGTGGQSFASMKRTSAVASIAVTSQQLTMVAVYLPAGYTVTELGWLNGATAAITPANQWLALFDNNRNMLARTADQGAAAIGANAAFQYPIAQVSGGAAASFTTTYSGLYYIGLLVNAATTPTPVGNAGFGTFVNAVPPIAAGLSTAALTAPPAFPFQGAAIAASAATCLFWAS